jgi:hypothetical protein
LLGDVEHNDVHAMCCALEADFGSHQTSAHNQHLIDHAHSLYPLTPANAHAAIIFRLQYQYSDAEIGNSRQLLGNLRLIARSGLDTLSSSGFDNTLVAGNGVDTLLSNGSSDTLLGIGGGSVLEATGGIGAVASYALDNVTVNLSPTVNIDPRTESSLLSL